MDHFLTAAASETSWPIKTVHSRVKSGHIGCGYADLPVGEFLFKAGQAGRLVLTKYISLASQRGIAVGAIVVLHNTDNCELTTMRKDAGLRKLELQIFLIHQPDQDTCTSGLDDKLTYRWWTAAKKPSWKPISWWIYKGGLAQDPISIR